jgi:hypothetical protein
MKSLDFKFGAMVYGRETPCGHLAQLVIEPESGCITDIIPESGLVFKQKKVVSVSEVEEASAMGIQLGVGCQELAGYPTFSEMVVEHSDPPPGWMAPVQSEVIVGAGALGPTVLPTVGPATVQEKVRQGVADDRIVWGNKVDVYGADGRLGHLSHLITTADVLHCQIQYLVVTQGALLANHYLIPIRYAQTLSEQGIHLLVSKEDIGEFPEFFASLDETNEVADERERSV